MNDSTAKALGSVPPIVKDLMAQMENQLGYFRNLPIDRKFRPQLEGFLKQWEQIFSPYLRIRFDYRIDGQHLDISATIPELPKYVINFVNPNYDPKYQYGF